MWRYQNSNSSNDRQGDISLIHHINCIMKIYRVEQLLFKVHKPEVLVIDGFRIFPLQFENFLKVLSQVQEPGFFRELWFIRWNTTLKLKVWHFNQQYKFPVHVILINVGNLHRNGKVVMVTALAVTGDVEACIRRLQWRSEQSSWRHIRFNVCGRQDTRWEYSPKHTLHRACDKPLSKPMMTHTFVLPLCDHETGRVAFGGWTFKVMEALAIQMWYIES